ncbi:hypothetical protein V6Z11_D05G405900 [Gossypium hirsutum]
METLWWSTLFFFFIFKASTLKIINPGDVIKDGGETLESENGTFEMGFFSPGNSNNRYIGIWYKFSNTTVVWVANREAPVSDNNGVLSFDNNGILTLFNETNGVVWYTNPNTSRTPHEPVLQLFDSGNLVVKEKNEDDSKNFFWESFDFPSDNLLPGMKIGINLITGFEYYISSWKSSDDPSQGQYSLRIDPHGYPQVVLKKGSETVYRAGSWDGHYLSARKPDDNPIPLYSYNFVINENEIYFKSELKNSSFISRYTMDPSGLMQRFIWNQMKNEWQVYSTAQADGCSTYGLCGSYASCKSGRFPLCSCLEGFKPKSSMNTSDGCSRTTELGCSGDGFLKQRRLALPDTSKSWANGSMNLKECEEFCVKNCACTAYANLDVTKGSGCLVWLDELIDITEFSQDVQPLYIRLPISELDKIQRKMEKKKAVIIAISIIVPMGSMVTLFLLYKLKKNLSNKEAALKN